MCDTCNAYTRVYTYIRMYVYMCVSDCLAMYLDGRSCACVERMHNIIQL